MVQGPLQRALSICFPRGTARLPQSMPVAALGYFMGSSSLFYPFKPLSLDKREKKDRQERKEIPE